MDVSVVIPCLNRERFIDEAIGSALGQGAEVEVIVVDDGSTDGSLGRIASYGDRVVALQGPGTGPSAARNVGLAAARGRYVHFLDSDDRLVPGALTAMVEASLDLGAKRVGVGDFAWIDEWGERIAGGLGYADRFTPGEIPRKTIVRYSLANPMPLYPVGLIREVGGFDQRLRHNEERELTMRLLARGVSYTYVPVAIAEVRVHGDDRLSSDVSCNAYSEVLSALKLMNEALDDPAFNPSREERAAFAALCWTAARNASRAKCKTIAEELFAFSQSIDRNGRAQAHWSLRGLYSVLSPYAAEQVADRVKIASNRLFRSASDKPGGISAIAPSLGSRPRNFG